MKVAFTTLEQEARERVHVTCLPTRDRLLNNPERNKDLGSRSPSSPLDASF